MVISGLAFVEMIMAMFLDGNGHPNLITSMSQPTKTGQGTPRIQPKLNHFASL